MMDYTLVFQIVFGSSVTASVVSYIFSYRAELRHKEETRQENFYSKLRASLLKLEVSSCNKKDVMDDFSITQKEWVANKTGRDAGEIIMDINRKRREIITPLTKDWWQEMDNLHVIIENGNHYFQEDDREIFKRFLIAYGKRKIIGKDNASDDTAVYLPESKYSIYMSELLNMAVEMNESFNKKRVGIVRCVINWFKKFIN